MGRLGGPLPVVTIAVACGSRTGFESSPAPFTGRSDAPDDEEPAPATETPPSSMTECPGSGGPKMALLPEGYCIDRTEVTRAQYRAWLETSPSLSHQTSRCSGKATYAPDALCMTSAPCQTGCDDHPQVCVDWCDADAYCRAVGKRLCGKVGGGSTPVRENYSWTDAAVNEWFNACSAHNGQKYANGKTYVDKSCNGPERDERTTLPVGSLRDCQSLLPGYQGIFDLSGNVSEWENSCDEYEGCRFRGGNYVTSAVPGGLACAVDNVFTMSPMMGGETWFIGFRCCATP